MEPVSFAVGIIGLAGLFSTCLEAVERFDSWKDYDSEFRSLVAQFKAQKLRLAKWGVAVGLEDDELSYVHNTLLDDPKIESMVKELLLAIDAVCRDEDKAFLTPMLGKDETPTKDQLFHRHAPRESKRQKLGWVFRTKAKRVTQVDNFSKLVDTLHNLIPIEDPKEHMGRRPTGDRVSEADGWRNELENLVKRMETQMEDEYRRDLQAWLLGSSSSSELYEIFSERKIKGTCEWVLGQPWFLDWNSPDFPTGCAKILWINGHAGFGNRDEPEIRACLVNESNTNDTIVIQHSITPEDFLWVQMQESQLRDWKSPKQLEKAINSTPPGLDKTYDREWMGISHLSEDNRERSIALLRWAAFALRPLSIRRGVPGRINENYIRTEMMELCGSLIDIRSPEGECDPGSKTVHLAHFTVKEYLLCNLPVQGRLLQLNSSLKFSTEGMENTLAARMCLCYVDCEEVWQETSEEGRAQVLGSFRDYAAGSWYQHASFGNIRDSELVQSVKQLFDIENPNWGSWKEWFDLNDGSQEIGCFDSDEDPDPPTSEDKQEIGSSKSGDDPDLSISKDGQIIQTTSMSPLYYATWLGLTDTMDLLLQSEKCSIDEQGNFGRTPLSAACERGHLDVVKKLLDNDADLEIAGDNEHTPLHAAACSGHAEVVKLLLEKGAKIHNGSDGSKTSLYCACLNGHHQVAQMLLQWEPELLATHEEWIPLLAASQGGFLDIVQLLIQRGADIGASDSFGQTPLYIACEDGHIEVVRLLLDKGADVHHPNQFGWTPVNTASDEGFSDIVLLLVERGADINVPNESGETPLYNSSWGGHSEVVRLLLEGGADIEVQSESGETPLSSACRRGHIEVVRLLLDKGAEIHHQSQSGWTPVNDASEAGFFDIVQLLIERGADIEVQNESGETPLYLACENGHVDVVRLLLDKGANVHHSTHREWTAVHIASQKGFLDIVLLLIDRAADINAQSNYGETALLRASSKGHLEVVKSLVAKGADFEIANRCGLKPLIVASERGFLDVLTLLLEEGAKIEDADDNGRRPLHRAAWKGHLDITNKLLENGANIASVTEDGRTPLHFASYNNSLDVVNLLLEKEADIKCVTKDGVTPLHFASYNDSLDVVSLLIDKGADIESVDVCMRTPLHEASVTGNLDVVNLLLERGAAINSVTEGGVTPLHAASLNRFKGVVERLLKQGAVFKSVAKGGATPLHFASYGNSLDVVNILVDKGADIESVDVRIGTPLHIASVSGNLDVVNLLLERGAAIEKGNFDDKTLLRYVSPHGQLEVINNFLHSERLRIDIRVEKGCTPIFYVVARGPSKMVKLLLLRLHTNAKDRYSAMRLLAAARNGYEEVIEQLITLAGRQSNLDGLGRELIWWAIGIGRGRILGLIHQWCYTQSFGARIPQASDGKLWSLVNLDLRRICDVCTRPMLINTSYRRCEGCNNFNICLDCVGVKVECLDTVHEWSSCEHDYLGEDGKDGKNNRNDDTRDGNEDGN
ncbi:hypothetical protein HAV15_010745 [Penicillium sp. str. |nr:hypothetical protein HAV15_010745 [Penicillium sp. str. \